ncbi:terpenoid synthase [Mycena metata]|uniref:Terpenoid synthase n=1 Tax=Mycena metata TaxID=1033252 RepID=A0AAD7NJ67_9AGAR|nr:terpenoid synthase [Mycena metata]
MLVTLLRPHLSGACDPSEDQLQFLYITDKSHHKSNNATPSMSTLSNYTHCIKRLLVDIGYRDEPLPAYDSGNYWGPFHSWMLEELGPTSTWSLTQLNELEHAAGGLMERSYPSASLELKLLYAKLTAIAILIDDSLEDDAVHADILQFSHRLYLGHAQENGMLALYHENMKELSSAYGNDAVLRGLAIAPWINYIDACLVEKMVFTTQRDQAAISPSTRHSPAFAEADALAPKFPHYLRSKSGIAEAYAAGILKATQEQNIPLSRYIRILPDLTFFIEVMNDVLSFHKEELTGETYNLIQLRTRSLSSSGARGSGFDEEWTAHDTLLLLCDELRATTHRIDRMLRLEECEAKMRGETANVDIDEVDLEIARQWRGWRDGYISWHFECRRYKLSPLKAMTLGDK